MTERGRKGVVFIQIGNGEGERVWEGGDEWQLGTSRSEAAPMLSRADQGSVENDGRGRKTITTVSSVEHCYLICNRVMLVDAFFAKCTSQSNSPKKREATCRTLWSVTRAFAFRISSEREFVGFMGVNERKERERTPTEKVN